ncbi:hypothetical protein ACGFSB_08480 [Streptomyces sp. NPDC048441]|uniref:hypothetical protein n=1 Tax=Streptomyces sp. NPDC048441 TaxID=3365552 RepID=UPI0037112401
MRRGVRNVLGASTAVLCLGGLLAACGGGSGDDGYVATGAAAERPQQAPGKGVAPTGDVELVPLDGSEKPSSGKGKGGGSESPEPGRPGSSSGASPAEPSGGKAGSAGPPDASADSGPTTGGGDPGRTEGSSGKGSSGSGPGGTPSDPGDSSSAPAGGPAKLSVGEPRRKAADDRWCERVTVTFHNTGGSPVRSGTVTFGTHVIGALGIDWATVETTEKLPAPIGAGERVKKTWPVCVEAWRVPLGMHVETRDISVKWK